MGFIRRWSGMVLLGILVSVPFSSCTCQRDVPEPPARVSLKDRKAWGGLPTPRRAEKSSEHGDLVKNEPIERERPTAVPAKDMPPEEVELPENFPDDVPIFEGSELYGVQNLAQGAKNVLFQTDGEVPKVFDFYKDSMRGEGWNVYQEYQQEGQSFLKFTKGKMTTNMTVAEDPKTGKRIIAVMYYEEEELPFPEF